MKKIRSLFIIIVLMGQSLFIFAQPLPNQNGNGSNVGHSQVISLVGQPGSISGPTTVVSGIPQNYSIQAVSGAISYSWSYTGGGLPVGSGTNITLAATGSGILSVTANNNCGSSPASTLNISVLPVILTLQNRTITSGQDTCYAASQTITLAGGGTTFSVLTGGSVEIVAGQNILFEPGTQVQSGGHLIGRIATTGNYCVQIPDVRPVNTGDRTQANVVNSH